MRILLVGSRVLPYRHGGDKNFWLDLLHGLQRTGHEFEVLSLMVEDPDGYDFPVRRVPPIPMHLGADSRFNEDHRHLAWTNNYASKTLSLPRLERELRKRVREFRPDVIHFMDNYGPGTIGLRFATGRIPTAISAPTYNGTSPFYDVALRASFASFDAIVPFSDAFGRRLLELHIPPDRIRRIRWGIDASRFAPTSSSERDAARRELGLPADRFVVLWTGFTQQTDQADLHAAVQAAEQVLQHDGKEFEFLFSFKPEHFKESYRALARPGLRVLGSADTFRAARASANLLLCPIQDRRTTAAPPLVWLECLAMGMPILTTDIPGAEETAVPGRSGFADSSVAGLAARMREIRADEGLQARLQAGARDVAMERFTVERALAEHVDLWSRLSGRAGA